MASNAPSFYPEAMLLESIKSKTSDRSFEYIIRMNNELQTKLSKVDAELIVSESQRDELETEVDQITKARNMLAGYLKNEIEVVRHMVKIERAHQWMLRCNYWMMHLVLLVCAAFIVVVADTASPALLMFAVVCLGVAKFDMWFAQQAKYVETMKASIQKIDTSNERIWELIDNL